jgi:ketosteroid isomerase-like protein
MKAARTVAVEIAAARLAFVTALGGGYPDSAADLYTDDARLLAPSSELVRGRRAIRDFWRAGVDSGIDRVELESLDLQSNANLAYEIGRYMLRLTGDAGAPVVDRGKYLLVHRLDADGRWRRLVEMFNPDR